MHIRLIVSIISILITFIGYQMNSNLGILIEIFSISIFCVYYSYLNIEYKLNPAFWYPVIFLLYAISSPLLYVLDIYKYYNSYSYVLLIENIAIISFLIAYSMPYKESKLSIKFQAQLASKVLSDKLVLLFVLSLSAAFIVNIYITGFDSKLSKTLSNNNFTSFDFSLTMLNVVFSFIVFKLWENKSKWSLKITLFHLTVIVLAFIATAERDILFRAIVIYGLIYLHFKPKVKIYKVLIFSLFILLSTSIVKSLFEGDDLLSGLGIYSYLEDSNILKTIIGVAFGSELRTGSENLARIIESIQNKEFSFFYGAALNSELQSIVSLGFLSDRDTSGGMSSWFSKYYFSDFYERGGGAGFTLVGQGYLDYGALGVIFLFALYGMLVRYIYVRHKKSLYWFIAYLNIIPIVMLSTRQGIGAPISQSLKHVVIPLIAIWVLSKLLSRKRTR